MAMWFSLDGLMAGEIEMRVFQLGNLLDCISILFEMPVSSRLLNTQKQCGGIPSKNQFSFSYY